MSGTFQRILPRWPAMAALILIAWGLLMPLPPGWSAGWRGELLNRLHAPLACGLTLALAWQLPSHRRFTALISTMATAVILTLAEMVQPWFGRTASWADLGWTLIGVMAGGIGLVARWKPRGWPRLAGMTFAFFAALAPPGWWSWKVLEASMTAKQLLPALLPPQPATADFFWQPAPRSNTSARLVMGRNEGSAVAVRLDARNEDWSRYGGLEIEGDLQHSVPLEIGIRLDLDDAAQTRVRTSLMMQPGTGTARAWWPAGTQARHTRQLVLFLPVEAGAARLLLRKIRLVEGAKPPEPPPFSPTGHN